MNVLISAYACEPNRGSEPGVGWKWSCQAAVSHNVWVLTRSIHKEAISRVIPDNQNRRLHFVYVDLPAFLDFKHHDGLFAKLHYMLWQVAALHAARKLSRQIAFDLTHQLTFNTIDIPGLLWFLGPCFVWGPVGAGQCAPESMKSYFGDSWKKETRRTRRKRLIKYSPLHRIAAKRTSIALASNKETAALLGSIGIKNVQLALDARVDVRNERPPLKRRGSSFLVGWSGTFTPNKAPGMALDVLKIVRDSGADVSMIMVGDGVLWEPTRRRVGELGLSPYVHFVGWISHDRMIELYQDFDLFLFTSLRDTSGNVVLEAMANGTPVVALDHQGVSQIVTSSSGRLVTLRDPRQVVVDLAQSIVDIVRDPELFEQLQIGAHERSKSFSVESITQVLEFAYSACGEGISS